MEKIEALAKYLECEVSELTEEKWDNYGLTVISDGRQEYAIGTDEECEAAWMQSLENYISECIEPELDFSKHGNLSAYITFDREMWIRDAKMDGRGHSLSAYDGEENKEGEYFIYRTN